ncbi:MAG TPA: prolipoprotein diacylglyceryl transferase family protein [Polyangiaceae bacterium]|nr:prolipoprotein diacylglyceryl transferase family protein [Polyangiaceae bacterium]
MYPTLYHAVHDLFGVDLQILKLINTFGFFVALAFLGAARCMAAELERKHELGLLESTRRPYEPPRPTTPLDLLISGLVAFVVGYKVLGIVFGESSLQGGADTQRYLLSTRGHLGAGIITGLGWMAFRYREIKAARTTPEPVHEPEFVEMTPRDHTMGITGAAALGGLIGAKLFHFLERPRSIIELFEHPSLSALFSGLTIYGGLILGTLFVYLYCRRNKLTFVHVADSVAPGLMLAYGVGRLGCHFSGDGDWGIPSQSPAPSALAWLPHWFWSYDYPNNVIGSGVRMAEGGYPGYGMHLVPPVFPTPLYESLAAFALFALLWSLRKHIERPLVMFGVYMMVNGFERFWIEKIRVNATYDLFGKAITQAEIIAVLMFVGGAILILVQKRSAPPVPAPASPEPAPSARD